VLQQDGPELDPSALFGQVVVDRARLDSHIRRCLQTRAQISLRELVERQPLQHGLAELVTYLQLGSDTFRTAVDEDACELIDWQAPGADGHPSHRQARLPRVTFLR
jgi:hypothetical protein